MQFLVHQFDIRCQRGFSFIEVIVATALLLLMFSGLMAGIQLMMELIGHSKAEAGARSLAVSRMEYIRSLDYDAVGTVAGIPSGNILQNSSTTLNGITYNERVLIQYLDREEDGFAGADTNGITEDSKRIKIEYTWNVRGKPDSLIVVSDIVPQGIESTAGGGTLLINVFDASVQPVSGASVRVFNNSVATDTIDVIVTTNANGIANFPGAPARGGYEITVTKSGYSTDQTYSASSTNSSPNPPHVSVSAGAVSTVYFSIDEVSDLTLRTISTPVKGVFSDSFSSSAQIASSSNITISGGGMTLTTNNATGTVYATTTAPSTLDSWESMDFNGTTTANTSYRIRLYEVTGSGTTTAYTLLPDIELPGNSAGFISGPIDVTSIDASTYGSLALGATLVSTDSGETPELYDWSLTHIESETPVSGVTFDVAGDKSIGTHSGQPVLKYQTTVTTDGSGEAAMTGLEWDSYSITLDGSVEGYDISEAYAPLPYALSPGVTETLTLVLEPHSPYSLRVTVVDTVGAAVGGADVRLYNGGFDQTLETSIYGQVYFDSVSSSTDYTLDVTASGYDPDSQTNVSVTGTTEIQVVLADEGTGGSDPGGGASSTPSTYLTNYNNRVPLTISGSSLFGNVTDFPVYVDLSDLPAGFFSGIQSSGADLRVTEGDGLTEVPFDLVAIDTGAQTGQLHFKAPSLTISTTTTFYIYYGHSTGTAYSTGDTYGRDNVWTNDFLGVYHLEEAAAGSGNANLYVDATGNGYDGDDNVDATDKTGQLGLGQEFNDSFDDNIELPNTLLNGRTNVTLSFWYRTNTNDYMTVLSGAQDNTSDGANEYLFWFRDRNDIQFFSHGDPRVNFDISNINDNVYRHYVSVRDDSNNQTRLYINGSEDNQSPATDSMTALDIASGGLFIGVDQDSIGGSFGQELDGELDEVRISSVVRSSSWIANEYSNQNSPTGFYSIGSIETE